MEKEKTKEDMAMETLVAGPQQRAPDELSIISELTPQESKFCDLYCNGGKEFVGKALTCFREAFGATGPSNSVCLSAKRLLKKTKVAERVNELVEQSSEEMMVMKRRLTASLFAILEETRDAIYTDRFDNKLSPAPLRSVAVNAAKAIADINNIGDSGSKLTVDASNAGVVFNVIAPTPKFNPVKIDDE